MFKLERIIQVCNGGIGATFLEERAPEAEIDVVHPYLVKRRISIAVYGER